MTSVSRPGNDPVGAGGDVVTALIADRWPPRYRRSLNMLLSNAVNLMIRQDHAGGDAAVHLADVN